MNKRLSFAKGLFLLFPLIMIAAVLVGCSTDNTATSDNRPVLGSYEFILNPASGQMTINPLSNSPHKTLTNGKYLGPLYNLGWGNSLDFASGTIRIKPIECAPTDYNAESQIVTASVKLINQTNTGSSICPTGAETYCNQTYKAPIELRIYSIQVFGFCDTVADPTCSTRLPGTPPFTQAYLTSMNKDSGCNPVVDANANGFLDCLADDPTFVYTSPNYPEYQYHPTWDYTSKCDTQTQNPTQALDPNETSGCKFLQFTFDHPQLDATHIPILAFSADILGYVMGAGLPAPTVAPVNSPTKIASQTITVTLTTIDANIKGDTVKITGGTADVICKDNDPCDTNAAVGTVAVSVNLNTNIANNLYVYQNDTIPPTSESPATGVQIVHDTVAPTISATDPLSNAVDISVGTNVLITFNEPVDPLTITTGSIKLNNGAIAGTVTISPDKYTAIFNPNVNLTGPTVYTVAVCANTTANGCTLAVKDTAGNTYNSGGTNYTYTFTTASSDLIPPVVNSTNPPDNASGISLNSTISVTFSEGIDASTVNATNFAVTKGGVPVAGSYTLSVDGTTATFTPGSLLTATTLYNVTIKGPAGIKDLAGNFMAANYLFSFTTGAAADVTPPYMVSTNPENSAININLYVHPQVIFSEPINPTTVTNSSLYLKKSDETILGASVSLSEDGLTATLTPFSPLQNSNIYVLTIGETIADLAGNTLLSPQTVQFTTLALPDTTPPTVSTTFPNWYASSASVYTNVIVNFSEPLDPNTVSTATIKLSRTSAPPCGGTLTPIPGTVAVSDDGYTAYFWQQTPPVTVAGYCITIVSGANGVKDLAGNALAANYTSFFKTANTTATPYIVGVAPAAASTGVPTNSNIIVTFSEAVLNTTVIDANFYLRLVSNVTHIPGVITLFPDKIHARFNPTSALLASTPYQFMTTTGIHDLSNTRSFTASTTAFTTGASADSDGPTITLPTNPANGATGVERWQNITLTFNEPIDPTTVSLSSIDLIRDYDSSNIAFVISLSANGLVITINPLDILNNNEFFTVKAKTSIRNLSGFALQSFTWFQFRTKDTSGDTTAPTVQSVLPTGTGASRCLATTGKAAIVFMSEPIDPDSATDGWFSLWDGTTLTNVYPITVTIQNQITGDPNPGMANSKVLLSPLSLPLLSSTRYYYYIDHRGAWDYAGNHLAADDQTRNFRTGTTPATCP